MTTRSSQSTHAGTLALRDALGDSEPLARLMQRLDESHRRFDAIAGAMPPNLLAVTRPGPLDDDGSWTLLAAHNAAAAKLRQLLPALCAAAAAAGWSERTIRIKVVPRG